MSRRFWTQEDEEFLKAMYDRYSIKELSELLNRTPTAIHRKVRALGIINRENYNKDSLVYVFKKYKGILNGQVSRGLTHNRHHLSILFKYYLKRHNIECSKSFFTDVIVIGDFLGEAKLKTYVKKSFNLYFSFLCFCFPNYHFQQYEFKNLDVENGFWDNKSNRFKHIESSIKKLKKDKVILNDIEILSLTFAKINEYFSKTLIYYYGKDSLYEYLKCKDINADFDSVKYFNDVRFDSFEEMEVYKTLLCVSNSIKKPSKKDALYNSIEDESYITDFIINDCIYIEYYGLWSSKGKFPDYNERVERKNEFYDREGYRFIPLYPSDLQNKNNIIRKVNEMLLGKVVSNIV